jgi:hypothetical protein
MFEEATKLHCERIVRCLREHKNKNGEKFTVAVVCGEKDSAREMSFY